MTYNQFVAKISGYVATITETYISGFTHGYYYTMNDNNKTFPHLLLEPVDVKWYSKSSNDRKIYPVKLYLFALSDGKTPAQRDTEWANIETALDALIASLITDSAIVLSSQPIYERLDDESGGSPFTQRMSWIEATFELIIDNC